MSAAERVCPGWHKHNTVCMRYHGCRCEACRAIMAENRRRRQPRDEPVMVLCVRCGIPRMLQRRTLMAPLCPDCKAVLTEDERKAWAA